MRVGVGVGLDGVGPWLHDDDPLVGEVVDDGPVEAHVGRGHKVLDEGKDAEGCKERNTKID